MRITSNYTIPSYNNRNCKKPAFQAKVEDSVLQSLREKAEARNLGLPFENQLARISQWGERNSVINISVPCRMDETGFGTPHLALYNEKMSTKYGGSFNIDESKPTLEQFFSLTEKDILDAEKEIVQVSRLSKLDAIKKIVQSPEYMEEITGKKNPTDRELSKGLRNLTEEQFLDYRFDLRKVRTEMQDLVDSIDYNFDNIEK